MNIDKHKKNIGLVMLELEISIRALMIVVVVPV